MNESVHLRFNGVIVARATDELYAAMIAIAERRIWAGTKTFAAPLSAAIEQLDADDSRDDTISSRFADAR